MDESGETEQQIKCESLISFGGTYLRISSKLLQKTKGGVNIPPLVLPPELKDGKQTGKIMFQVKIQDVIVPLLFSYTHFPATKDFSTRISGIFSAET